ncbi:hypothetical protein BV25DRAFT_1822041 [Artomyces pyxidatus]|uniref:Uncharacterized protein n=1 Tax=Artomyces pyxidatus TaxID=48021 RepID=A0ACB8TC26_9AGAM|nr:hypothetical protein BV25DRAFT_1822041 [Artomyces pyxidatus]
MRFFFVSFVATLSIAAIAATAVQAAPVLNAASATELLVRNVNGELVERRPEAGPGCGLACH